MNRLLFLLACLSIPSFADAPRPNILYLYVDDMGWGSLAPNGQAERRAKGLPHVITPNLDRIAAQGVNFSTAYGCTVCSPARSSQQTGFHQGHTFADRNDPDNAKKAIRKEDRTMGECLLEAGYATGYWGKWGYGGSKDMQNPTIDNVQTLPTSHGYQRVVAELHHVRAHTFFQPTLWTSPTPAGFSLEPNSMQRWQGDPKRYPNQPALQNHPQYPEIAYCDDVYAFDALDFVRQHAQSEKPFFALVAFQVPHAPFREIEQLPKWDAAYRDQPWFAKLKDQPKQWAAMVTRIDGHIGNLLAALEDPNNDGDTSDSVAANTLVVFQSDNGGPQQASNQAFDANGGLTGGKGGINEGGIRVPTLMRWPAKITAHSRLKAGSSTDMLLDVTDLLPTFCELAGAPAPLGVDGISIAPTLLGEGFQPRREFVIHEAGPGKSIIWNEPRVKLIQGKKGMDVYNLTKDPAEKKNLAGQDPAHDQKLLQTLQLERVDEPKGFATTYHHWTGKTGNGKIQDADNWSDYVYENASIRYIEQTGPPQPEWIATIRGTQKGETITLNQDLHVLALSLEKTKVTASGDAELTARNELRIGPDAQLSTAEGRVASRIIRNQGTLAAGHIQGTVWNQGVLSAKKIEADLILETDSTLSIQENPLVVSGTAQLGGTLIAELDSQREKTILQATTITGTFDQLPAGIRIQIRNGTVTAIRN